MISLPKSIFGMKYCMLVEFLTIYLKLTNFIKCIINSYMDSKIMNPIVLP